VLTGMGVSTEGKLFMGWFGPRGLASIVFGVIVVNAHLQNSGPIAMTVVCTIMLSILAHEPYLYTGFIFVAGNKGSRTGKTFWVHEWYDNYHELSIRTSFQTPKDLRDIAVDVGAHLGLGHPRNISDTDSSGLRATLASTLEKLRVEIEQTISDLARQTVAAWQQFRREATTGKTGTSRN
jgi:hypothetical protein